MIEIPVQKPTTRAAAVQLSSQSWFQVAATFSKAETLQLRSALSATDDAIPGGSFPSMMFTAIVSVAKS
jgi:hypothetical protein